MALDLARAAARRYKDPDVALKLTPLAWLSLEDLLSAASTALTWHSAVKGYDALKSAVRELTLHLTALMSLLGLRADVSFKRVGDLKLAFIDLIDCSCSLEPGEQAVRVMCDCNGLGRVSYSIALPPRGPSVK